MAATPSERPGKPGGSKLTHSIVLGMMLIPVSVEIDIED
jgi:hypothetical protein